ncbi:hypothetical protein [Neobacillus sp. LXY-4]|uniref:YfjL-like protein n=1 Tax=Neobacillus sp. LXY-4 TaxID=3379826 RepID=UPI003EE37893
MKARKIFIWTSVIIISLLALFIYSLFNGTPWGKYEQKKQMEVYLENKYQLSFQINNPKYNFLSETYQAYASPKDEPELKFFVEQDIDSQSGYSDTYPTEFWKSNLSNKMKAKIKDIFPELDESSLSLQRIVERGEYYGTHIPTYKEAQVSHLASSLTINIRMNWDQVDQSVSRKKIEELAVYLQSVPLPVLVEVWYYETDIDPDITKAIFITDNGRIVEK